MFAAALLLLASSCSSGIGSILSGQSNGTNSTDASQPYGGVLGNIFNGIANKNTVNSLIEFVIGKSTVTSQELAAQWKYYEPGCAFTSEKLLAEAGGAVAAGQIKEKLAPIYSKVGISATNTTFVFDGSKFQARIGNIPLSGTYVYNQSDGSIKLNATLISLTGYVTRTTKGIAITFESKKLLTVLQTASSITGNTTIKTIGDIANQYDGIRVGFNVEKQ